ncbi:hypothetical protein JTB14_015390 [Gonioctena quinquepunctata]|nr:hypothetical protein JTB14_015390 [Gonioctena quinquepunctata]
MDSIEEKKLLQWYEELSSGESCNISKNSYDGWENEQSDPFEDDGTYGNDPNFDPKNEEDYDSTSSSDNGVLVDHRQVISDNNNSDDEYDDWVETLGDIPNTQFDETSAGIKIQITGNVTLLDVFNLLWSKEVTDLLLNNSNAYG